MYPCRLGATSLTASKVTAWLLTTVCKRLTTTLSCTAACSGTEGRRGSDACISCLGYMTQLLGLHAYHLSNMCRSPMEKGCTDTSSLPASRSKPRSLLMEWHSLAWVSLSKEPLRQERFGGVPFFLMLAIRGTSPSLTCKHGGRVYLMMLCFTSLLFSAARQGCGAQRGYKTQAGLNAMLVQVCRLCCETMM